MKKLYIISALLAVMLLPLRVGAQFGGVYNFFTGVDTSAWLTLSDSAEVFTMQGDDVASGLKPIGFSFGFAGQTFTQWSTNSNGRVRLGSVAIASSQYNTPFNNAANLNNGSPLIAPLGCDGYFYPGDSVWYEVLTVDTTHVLVIQCTQSVQGYQAQGHFSWQVQLYSDGNLKIVYGEKSLATGKPSKTFQVGVSLSSTDFCMVNVTTNVETWCTVYNTTTNPSTAEYPANGRYYTFRPATCRPVSNFRVESVSAYSAVLAWDANNNAASYTLIVNDTVRDVIPYGDSTYTISVTPASPYNVALRTVCSTDDSSALARVNFETPCAGSLALPHVQNFDNMTTVGTGHIPTCYTNVQMANTYPYVASNSTNSMSGSNYLYDYLTSTYNTSLIATHAVAVPINGIYASVNVKMSATSGILDLGYMTNITDASSFVPMSTVMASRIGAAKWGSTDFILSSSDVNGDTIYVAIRCRLSSTTASYFYIDDLFISEAPTCGVSDIVFDSIEVGHVVLSWRDTLGGASSYSVMYGTGTHTTDATNVVISNVMDTTATIDSLNPSSTYSFWVRSVCGTDTMNWHYAGQARIPCVQLTYADLPLHEHFNNYTSGTSGTIDPCWYKVSYSSTATYPYPNATHNHDSASGKGLYFYPTYSNDGDQFVVLPSIENVRGLKVTFWIKATAANGATYGRMAVGVMTNPADRYSFTPIAEFAPVNGTWVEHNVSLADYAGTGSYIAFRAHSNSGSQYICLDDIHVEVEPCQYPTQITTTIDNGAPIVTWVGPASGDSYTLVLGENDTITTTQNTIVLNGLTSATTYYGEMWTTCTDTISDKRLMTIFVPIDTLPYRQNFNDLNSRITVPGGWLHAGNGTMKAYTDGDYLYDGTQAFHLTGSTSNNIAILPEMPVSLQQLYMNFKLRAHNHQNTTSGSFDVGYITDVNDASTFVSLYNYGNGVFYKAYNDITVYFTNAPANARIAVRANQTNSNDNYSWIMDNVEVDVATCVGTLLPIARNITSRSAAIEWNSLGDGESYRISYNGRTITTSDTLYTLTGLAPSASYEISLTHVCPNEVSAPAAVRFNTMCDTIRITDLPLYENCDLNSSNTLSNCWTKRGNLGNLVGTDRHAVTSNMLYFYGRSYSNVNLEYVITPPIEDVTRVTFNFWSKNGSNNNRFEVGVMTNPNDTTTFVLVETLSVPLGSAWTNFDVRFDNYTGEGHYIAVRCHDITEPSGNGAWILIDDISILEALPCLRPSSLVVDTVTTTSATVSVVGDTARSRFMLVYQSASSLDTVYFTNSTYTLTNLKKSTFYTLKLASICTQGDDTTSIIENYFTTACGDTLEHSDLPFVEDFDRYSYNAVAYINPCYHRLSYVPGSPVGPYPKNAYTRHIGVGNSFLFEPSDGNKTMYFMLPPMRDVNDLKVEFSVYRTNSNPVIEVGVMSDPDDTNTFVLMQSCVPQYNNGTEDFEVSFVSYHGTGNYIAFRARSTAASGNNIAIDDIIVREDNCPVPMNIVASDFHGDTATLSWSNLAPGATYQVNFGSLIRDSIVADTFLVISGLAPLTTYDVTIRTNCTDGNHSRWATTSIVTPVTSLPYTQNFNSMSTLLVNRVPAGWAKLGNGIVEYVTLGADEGNTMRITDATSNNVVLLPTFIDAISGLSLEFNMRPAEGVAADGTFQVGYVTDASDVSSFVAVETYSYSQLSASSYSSIFVQYLSAPVGSRMALRHNATQSTGAWMVDQILVDYNTCPSPRSITIESVSTTSATLSWRSVAAGAQYLVTVGDTTFLTTDTNILVSGLEPNTAYNVRMARYCGVGDTSRYAANSFRTECTSYGLPYTENFESYTNVIAHNVTGAPMPDCWDLYYTGTGASAPYNTKLVSSSNVWASNSGHGNHLFFVGSTNAAYGTTSFAVLPQIDGIVPGAEISYDYAFENASYGNLMLGYVTGSNYVSSFVSLHTSSPATSSANSHDTIVLTDSIPAGARLAFRFLQNGSGTWYSAVVDNISIIAPAPVCPDPVIVMVDSTYNSITITWMGTDSTEMKIAEGTLFDETAQSVYTNGSTYTFTGLQRATEYTIGIRQICDVDFYSEWVLTTVNTLDLNCQVPDGLAASATFDEVSLTWTPGGSETRWEARVYNTTDTFTSVVETPAATITGLISGVAYQFDVRAFCGDQSEVEGEWSAPISFSTETCAAVREVTVEETTETSIVISWNAPANGDGNYTVMYGITGFDQGTGTSFTVSDTRATISDLESETTYDIYVANTCNSTLLSVWSPVVSVTTAGGGTGAISVVDLSSMVSLYPNPATSDVTISLGDATEATISIVDMNGRVVKTAIMHGSANVNVSDLAQGAYFVRIVGSDFTAVSKLIVK